MSGIGLARCASQLVLLLAVGTTAAAQELPYRGTLEPGPYAVGFRTERVLRTVENGSARSLALSLWYPARESDGPPVALSDLFAVVLEEDLLEETRGLAPEQALSAAMTGEPEALSIDAARSARSMPTFAQRDAVAAVGPFPLALWSSRHATVLAQAPLSELLASHGYVVATVWSSDPPLAFLWEDRSEADKLATIAAHTGDLRHTLSRLRARDEVDAECTVVLAWSYGGQTAARLQEQEESVCGVLGLDANVVPARPEESLELRVPFVWLLGAASQGRGFDDVSALEAPTVVIGLPELAHGNFNALEGFLPGLFEASAVYRWSKGGAIAVDGYAALSRIALASVRALSSRSGVEALPRVLDAAAGDVETTIMFDGSSRRR